jgi:hypothetical protein
VDAGAAANAAIDATADEDGRRAQIDDLEQQLANVPPSPPPGTQEDRDHQPSKIGHPGRPDDLGPWWRQAPW